MIIFDTLVEKQIQMVIESEGINPSKLSYVFRLIVDGIEYGFPCDYNANKVTVRIPPLSSVIREIKPGVARAKLEINGDEKYYLKPFDEQIEIKTEPKIEVLFEPQKDDTNIKEDVKVFISNLLEEDTKVDEDKKDTKVDEDDKDKIKTRIRDFFDK